MRLVATTRPLASMLAFYGATETTEHALYGLLDELAANARGPKPGQPTFSYFQMRLGDPASPARRQGVHPDADRHAESGSAGRDLHAYMVATDGRSGTDNQHGVSQRLVRQHHRDLTSLPGNSKDSAVMSDLIGTSQALQSSPQKDLVRREHRSFKSLLERSNGAASSSPLPAIRRHSAVEEISALARSNTSAGRTSVNVRVGVIRSHRTTSSPCRR